MLVIGVLFTGLTFAVIAIGGCQSTAGRVGYSGAGFMSGPDAAPGDRLGVLSWVGGISLLAGIAALVITRGAMGVRAVLIGGGAVMLAYAVDRYANWIFVPVIVATGICSLALAFKTIRAAWFQRKDASK